LFLLDYDGTLTPIVNNPMDAIPSQRLISILTSLTRDPHNAVYVVSGRDRPFLNSFFGALPIGTPAHLTTQPSLHSSSKQYVRNVLADVSRLCCFGQACRASTACSSVRAARAGTGR
jgi:hypothetical protein